MTPYPLYDQRMEHESCGVGAVVDLSGQPTHRTVSDALTIVERLAHRAGRDALGTTGDGVGVLTQIPHRLFARWAENQNITLGKSRDYGVGMLFLPMEEEAAAQAQGVLERLAEARGLRVLCWRDVPCHPEILGEGALRTLPRIRQCFIQRPEATERGLAFDRQLYLLRRAFEKARTAAYVCSLSSRTIVYKGMMLVPQLRPFFDDLRDGDYLSAMAMVHSRFSTNTEPSWPRAHPHRLLLHNGEINTIRGNADRMLAREETMRSPLLGTAMKEVLPVIDADGSDSMMLDNALEFLMMNGLPLPLAAMTLIPEPWRGEEGLSRGRRDLYHYYSTLMEPWDGPASVLFSDGDAVCAALDRNGLRPMRCALTADRRVILSSEAGVLYEETEHIIRRWRLRAGDLLVADLQAGRLTEGDELKERYASRLPYGEWLDGGIKRLSDLKTPEGKVETHTDSQRARLCRAFGYSWEDLRDVILPMAQNGAEPIAAMGADEPIAALSHTHPLLDAYFKQRFAQVTNPPMDALREKLKTDATVYVGDDGNLLCDAPDNCMVLELASPVLTGTELLKIKHMEQPGFRVQTLSLLYPRESSLETALEALFCACDRAYENGVNVVILSDRGIGEQRVAIPALLAVSALEQYLVRTKKRTAVSVILESGEPRDAHQLALLIAFGARAVQPYLAHECVEGMVREDLIHKEIGEAIRDYDRALLDGVVRIASKMGVSTLQAYQSAQLFEAIGLDQAFVERYFTNTPCRLSGVGLSHIEEDIRWRHDRAFDPLGGGGERPDSVGIHRMRGGKGAEEHLYTPEVIHTLQDAVWRDDRALFDEYARLIIDKGPRTLRSLLDFRFENCSPVPLHEVEPVGSIVRRFRTGGMSYGSLSPEAHECLALAMNRLGGMSNSGEGGETPERLGTELNSAIKQVASGRFGVTSEYLLSARS